MRLLCAFLICVFLGNNLSEAEDSPLSALPDLHKGVNLSNWLANAERQPLKLQDFERIKTAGFDNVRLPVKPDLLEKNIAPVDQALLMAVRNNLDLVLDLHPDSAFMKALENSEANEQQFIALWVSTAKHYKNYRSSRLAFELLNEPQYYEKENRYNALIAKTVKAIREVDKDRLLIVAAPRGSSVEGLLKLKPVNDPKIIYDFHFYQPYMITHQGIHRGFATKMLRYFHDVPYPSELVAHDAGFYAGGASDPAKAEAELKAYVKEKWDRNHIEKALKPAKQWAETNKAKVICGEFGVLRNHIEAESRYNWIADVRKSLEFLGIGWQIWDYSDLDGITRLVGETRTDAADGSVKLADPEKGERVIEKEAIDALGLVQPVVVEKAPATAVDNTATAPAKPPEAKPLNTITNAPADPLAGKTEIPRTVPQQQYPSRSNRR